MISGYTDFHLFTSNFAALRAPALTFRRLHSLGQTGSTAFLWMTSIVAHDAPPRCPHWGTALWQGAPIQRSLLEHNQD